MPEIKETQLKKDLDKDNIGRLYFLYGEENYLVKRAAKRVIKKASGTAFLEFNFHEFSSSSSVDKIADAVEALPFMSERKCVAVSDFNIEDKDSVELSKLQELIENLPDTTTLLFYYPTTPKENMGSAKYKKIIKAMVKNGTVVEFKLRTPADLQKLLIRDAEKQGALLSKTNALRLIEYAGRDLKSLLNENAKLSAFAAGGEITAEMIDGMVPKSMETTIFMLSNALLAGNYEQAYKQLNNLFLEKADPIMMVSVLAGAYGDMYCVRASIESGKGVKGPAEYRNYKGKEFRLSKAEKSLRGVSTQTLCDSLEIILSTDLALKSSKLSGRILLDEMIAKLLLAAKGEEIP